MPLTMPFRGMFGFGTEAAGQRAEMLVLQGAPHVGGRSEGDEIRVRETVAAFYRRLGAASPVPQAGSR